MICTGTPISWPRLERHALAADAQIAEHLAACTACARCFDEIKLDVVALPQLVVPAPVAKRPWWHIAVPLFAVAVAALLFVVIPWPRETAREDVVTVKGVGEVILGVVRERDGTIRDDVHTFLPTDRWKVVITCPPAASAWVDVTVGDDRPLTPARIACGNRVVVPGAFHLTGTASNRVCVHVAADADTETRAACVVIRPE